MDPRDAAFDMNALAILAMVFYVYFAGNALWAIDSGEPFEVSIYTPTAAATILILLAQKSRYLRHHWSLDSGT
jgi:hypothetical protein